MTSVLVAAGIASGLTTALFPPQYLARVTVYRGDPLNEFPVETLGRSQMLLTAGQPGLYQVRQPLPREKSVSLQLSCRPDQDGMIRTDFTTKVVYATPEPGTTWVGWHGRAANENWNFRVSPPGTVVTRRLVADDPYIQTWAVITIHKSHGPPQLVSPVGRSQVLSRPSAAAPGR